MKSQKTTELKVKKLIILVATKDYGSLTNNQKKHYKLQLN